DIAVRDLDGALQIDDGDGTITWGELQTAAPRISSYVHDRLHIAGCPITLGDAMLVDLSDGAYWALPITASCTPTELSITYQVLFDLDAQHRGLIHVAGQTIIVRDGDPVHVSLGESTHVASFVREGVWHIWQGLDHILFLLCLVIPAFQRRDRLRD